MSTNLSNLSKNELETLSKELRAFRSAQKKIGKRAKDLFVDQSNKVHIELATGAEESSVTAVLKQLGLDDREISFSHNARLSGGARIFVGGDLYDLSFESATAKI